MEHKCLSHYPPNLHQNYSGLWYWNQHKLKIELNHHHHKKKVTKWITQIFLLIASFNPNWMYPSADTKMFSINLLQ